MEFRRLGSDAYRQTELDGDNLSGGNEARLSSTGCVESENRHLYAGVEFADGVLNGANFFANSFLREFNGAHCEVDTADSVKHLDGQNRGKRPQTASATQISSSSASQRNAKPFKRSVIFSRRA